MVIKAKNGKICKKMIENSHVFCMHDYCNGYFFYNITFIFAYVNIQELRQLYVLRKPNIII